MTRGTSDQSYLYFEGDVYCYHTRLALHRWVEFSDAMTERPKEFTWFQGGRILLRRLVNRRQRMMASLATDTFITNKNLYTVVPNGESADWPATGALEQSQLRRFLYI